MILALDYDDTYTRDPEFWNRFIKMSEERGHIVKCVTMRSAHEIDLDKFPKIEIITTNRKAKSLYVYEQGIRIDVWIDDSPWFLLNDG